MDEETVEETISWVTAAWNDVVEFFTGNVWRIVAFFATLFIGIVIVKLLMRFIKGILSRAKVEHITRKFILAIIRVVLYLVLVLILLSVIGVEISGLVTALSALVLAIGLALEDNIANVANGIVIVCFKIVKKGDFVEIDGSSGSVSEINFLFTTITTTDNKRITIPNSTVVGNALTNYGANPTRRVDFTFSVAYESDVELVKKIVTDVMKSDGRVLLTPKPPFCRLKTLNESSLDFFANCWCDNGDYWDVYYYVTETVYNEFKRAGISVPYKQIEVRTRVDEVVMPVVGDGLPQRVEKVREEQTKRFDIENADISGYINNRVAAYRKRKAKRVEAVTVTGQKEINYESEDDDNDGDDEIE